MNILVINHYAGSIHHGMEYRPYYLAREWVKLGHRVDIIAASFSHVRQRQPQVESQMLQAPLTEVIDGIHYHWLPTPIYQHNGIGRFKNILSFLSQVWKNSADYAQRLQPDAVIASSTYPLDIWVARHLAKKSRAQLIYEVHDLWPASLIELSGMSRHHPFVLLCQKAENDAYRDADLVVSMLPKVLNHMTAQGLAPHKLHIVPNGITLDEWQADPPPLRGDLAEHLQAQKAAGKTVVVYAGSHGAPNALDVLLDAAALLKHAPFAFVMVGDGLEKSRLQQRIDNEKLNHVRCFAPVPKAQIPSLLQQADIAYIGWQRTPLYRFGIAPNKLMDYMMARCVVLHSVEAGNDPVMESGCGLTVPPESAQAVAQGLQNLAQTPVLQRQQMAEAGRAFVLRHHTYPVLAQRFLDALTSLKS
jgi:glycosyltransferase involved in cell wall biosynthesis